MPQEQATLTHCKFLISAVEETFNTINQPRVTADLEWQWDEKNQILLTHFARNFAEPIQQVVKEQLPEHWQSNNIKKAPSSLYKQLKSYGKLTKDQCIFTRVQTDESPALIAVWWPWGHGSTFSLRIGILDEDYEVNDIGANGFWSNIKIKLGL